MFRFFLFLVLKLQFFNLVYAKSEREVSVMTYNVENLFDNQHDPGTEDYTYLPLKAKGAETKNFCQTLKNKFYQKECKDLDWNNDVLNAKLNNIASVISHVDHGNGPDNILLAEVENRNVLNQLVQGPLKNKGYKTIVLIEGPDVRGIDPAFISKYEISGEPKLHIIPYEDKDAEQLKWARRSRGILEVTVKIDLTHTLTFLVAHFPSQSNPEAWRGQAVKYAKELILKLKNNGKAVVFGGDLNITANEEKNKSFFKNEFSSVGNVSHVVGCKSCHGSHYYRGDWSFLDVLIFSTNFNELGFELISDSISIVKSDLNTDPQGRPKRFNSQNKTGASDHFPVFAKIKLLKKN